MTANPLTLAAAAAFAALLPIQPAFSDSPTARGDCGGCFRQSAFNGFRIKYLQMSFESLLDKSGAEAGAVCLAENGNILLAKSFPESFAASGQTFALGKSSTALVTLAAAAMQSEGKLDPNEEIAARCSYFRLSGSARRASLAQLWNGEFGFDKHADTLVPRDASSAEVFDIAAQIPPTADAGINQSKLAASIAGYAIGYISDKRQKNFKKSFAKAVRAYALAPLKMDGTKYRSFDSPFFPATAFALTLGDAAKWMACETDPNPKIATAQLISNRRIPSLANGKFGMGWIKSAQGKTDFYMCGDYFQNCANIAAVLEKGKIAAVFFVKSPDQKTASQTCAKALSLLIEMLQNPIPPSK